MTVDGPDAGTTTSGVVVAFDDAKGFGTVREDGNGHEHFFHCTAISDGTRSIEVGTEVRFEIAPGRNGQWEARAVSRR